MTIFTGTTGNDNFTGSIDGDVFNLFQGGSDKAVGGGGADIFVMGAKFNAGDRLLGGDGFDEVNLSGDYSGGIVFKASTFNDIERINLAAGFDYSFTFDDATASGTTGFYFYVQGGTLGASDSITVDASAETTRGFYLEGGAGDDLLIGGAAVDGFLLAAGGADTVKGGDGQDSFDFSNGSLTADDHIDGGADTDFLYLIAGVGAGIVFGADTMVSVEEITLGAGFDYRLTMHDNTTAAGVTLVIRGVDLGAGDRMIIDGSAERDGRMQITGGGGADKLTGGRFNDALYGGAASDTLKGGAGADYLVGGAGRDVMTGGAGTDTFGFEAFSDFGAGRIDKITDLRAGDQIALGLLDADATADGDQDFTLVSAFTGVAGEAQLRYVAASNLTFLELDVDGDAAADYAVALKGDQSGFGGLLL